MTAHVLYPALDPDRPATLSRRIATDLLRGELGFRGVLVSDDLGMKAVADRYPIEELAVGAIEAGVDHLLVREPAARQHAAFEAIVHAAEARSDLRARVEESAARVAALKAACTVALPAPVGDAAVAARDARAPGAGGVVRAVPPSAARSRRSRTSRSALAPRSGDEGTRDPAPVRRLTPKARPSPVGSDGRAKLPLRASVSWTDCIARICVGAVAGRRFGQAGRTGRRCRAARCRRGAGCRPPSRGSAG